MRNVLMRAIATAVGLGALSGVANAGDTGKGLTLLTVQPAALSAAGEGRRAFLKYNCYSCHGMFAAGGMGPNIVHAESGDVSEAVRQGEEGGMPAFGTKVTATEISNLAKYLASIGTASEPKFMDWWVAVPTK